MVEALYITMADITDLKLANLWIDMAAKGPVIFLQATRFQLGAAVDLQELRGNLRTLC